ncbi:hypothetical protein CIT292_08098 [Citrobacter youngae ATCC 29220]|uniref:Uncharacterized protein n=1 Tax=Citrobacter youngae ATCC 29220 TaxID=500640 RepID=D4BC92_9ENTR|nr:hypothetical protein CIT292_08098 [Citrobacter youngae ATCC 29220]
MMLTAKNNLICADDYDQLARKIFKDKKKAIIRWPTMSKRDQPLTMQIVRAVFLLLT